MLPCTVVSSIQYSNYRGCVVCSGVKRDAFTGLDVIPYYHENCYLSITSMKIMQLNNSLDTNCKCGVKFSNFLKFS